MTKRSRAALRLVFVAVGLAAALATVFLLTRHTRKASTTENHTAPAKTSNTATTAVPPVIHTNPPPKPEIVTNEFALLPFKLEKTPGSSLVYVTGTLQNLADRQRFGVKIQFDLFDAQTNAVGKASDYQSVFDPHSEWHFKALVIESKAASARFSRVTED